MNLTRKFLFKVSLIIMLFIVSGVFIQTGRSASPFSPDPLPTLQVTLPPGIDWMTVRDLNVETTTIWQENGQVFGVSRPIINTARDAALYQELLEGRLNSLPDEQILTAEVTFKGSLSLNGIESLLGQYTIISLLASGEDGSTRQVAYPPDDVPAELQAEFSQVFEALSGGTPAPSLSPDNYIAATVKASALLLRELAQKERVFTVDVGPVDLVSDFPTGSFSTLKDVSYDYELHVGSLCEFTLLRNRIDELSTNGDMPTAVKDELQGILTDAEAYLNANDAASARGEMSLFFETLSENSAIISEDVLKEVSVVGDCLVAREMQTAPVHVLSTDDSRVEYSYNLFDDCGLGACSTNWIQGNMSASSSEHDNLFDLDPLFASPENGAYQLSANSPAIDAGDPSLLHELFFDGYNDGLIRLDIGAFEYAPVEENIAPVVDAGTDQTIQLGDPATVTAIYTDADNSENHSARIDWGDGIVEDVPVTMTGPGAGEVTGEHTYSNAGNYIVEVCVTDLYGAVGCDTLTVEVNAFPSTSLLDDFNRANGGIGSNWSGNTAGYNISSNQLSVDYHGSNNDIYWKNEPFGANQEAYITFTQVDTLGTEQLLLLKSQSNATWGEGVLEIFYDALNERVQVVTWDWPQGWVQHGADIPVTFADGDQFGARAFADGTVEVYKNGSLLASRDITGWAHYADGGYLGLWFIGAILYFFVLG